MIAVQIHDRRQYKVLQLLLIFDFEASRFVCVFALQAPTVSVMTSRSCSVSTRDISGGSAGWPSAPASCWSVARTTFTQTR